MRRVSFPMAETVGFILIALGMVVSSLDTMVNQAFPAIVAAFDLKPPDIKWVPLSFIPFNGLVILVFGGLGDRFGYRLIFKIGLFAAAVALLLCSFAPNYGSFLVFRAFQGISAALVMSCTMALAIRILSQENRQKAVAIRVGAFFGLSAIGPIVGGILIELLGWTSVFWSRAICGSLGTSRGARGGEQRRLRQARRRPADSKSHRDSWCGNNPAGGGNTRPPSIRAFSCRDRRRPCVRISGACEESSTSISSFGGVPER
jgi:MFS family permease